MPRLLTLFVVLTLAVGTAQVASAQAADVAPPSSEVPELLPPGPVHIPSSRGGVLYDNGPYVNSPGTGPGGSDESLLQTALGMTIFGFGHACTAGFRVADDFTVPAGGWDIDEVLFYTYQTGSTTTSTITGVQLQIWDGAPGVGTVVFGDMTTNRLTGTTWDNAYRRTDTTPGTTRPVMESTVAADVTLPAGTYWLDWCTLGSLASGPWAPPITINGTTNTGNGQQFNPTPAPGAWGPAMDTTFPQGFPFQVIGSPVGGGTTFCSGVPTTIPDSGPFTPYPNTVTVSGITGTVTDVNVRLMGLSHTFPADLDIFVSSPAGTTAIVASDAGGSTAIVGVDVTLDDEAAGPIPSPLATGSYQPTNNGTGDTWDPPAPAPTANTLLSAFDGADPNGTWNLWGDDDAGGDLGSMADWCIDFTVGPGGPTVNTYPSTDTPLPIADGTGDNTPGPPTISTITVPPSPNEVLDVDVQLNITHTWAGDIAASLAHGAGVSSIFDRPGRTTTGFGCSGDNPNLTIDDEGTGGTVEGSCTNTTTAYPPGVNYTPNTPLSVFDGLPVDGTWVLTVNDFAGGDTGSLTSWAIIVTEDNTVNAPGGPTAGEASLRALPNPANGQSTVELTVPVAQQVRVAVYDMLGREVMVLLDRTVSESQRALMAFEASRLTPGAYVIRAVGETFQMSERVTITR